MVREIITLNVGECGINVGTTIWEQYNLEHGIDPSGKQSIIYGDNSFHCFYEETDEKRFIPRNLMIDLESEAINNITKSKYGNLFNSEYVLSGKDGADGCFARGYFSVGKQIFDKVYDKLRLIMENCDNVQGFMMNHAVGGGTGSGLGSLIFEKLAVDYKKKARIDFAVYPFNNNYSNNTVEPYNTLLSTHWSLEHHNISFVFDNRQLHNVCSNKLFIYQPEYFHMNSIIDGYQK